MKEIKQVNHTEFSEEYFVLVNKFYSQKDTFDYYISDLKKGLDYTIKSEFQKPIFFIIYKNNKIAGTISLILDSRIAEDNCFFGFFEFIEDSEVFDYLWKYISDFAKSLNIEKILGPINGTIWHQYRFIDKEVYQKTFPSEPITKTYYADFFKSKKPVLQEEYHSAFRTNFDVIMHHTKASYENVLKNDIVLEKVEDFNIELLKVLFAFSKQIFSKNWGFVPLNFNEFIELYNTDKVTNYIGSVHLAKFNSQIIGFCLNIDTEDSLIMKTIAVMPEYQQKGVASALVYTIHNDAKQNKKEYVIYPLINKKNKIQYFPKDEVTIMREYVAFEFKI